MMAEHDDDAFAAFDAIRRNYTKDDLAKVINHLSVFNVGRTDTDTDLNEIIVILTTFNTLRQQLATPTRGKVSASLARIGENHKTIEEAVKLFEKELGSTV